MEDKLKILQEKMISKGVAASLWEKPTLRRLYLNTPDHIKAYFQVEPQRQDPLIYINGVALYLETSIPKDIMEGALKIVLASVTKDAADFVFRTLNDAGVHP